MASGDAPVYRGRALVAERGGEIADHVAELVVATLLDDDVVGIFQVPVVNQRHHDLQALELRRAGERILFPLPFTVTFPVIRTCFEPDVCESSFAGNREARYEIVDLRVVD